MITPKSVSMLKRFILSKRLFPLNGATTHRYHSIIEKYSFSATELKDERFSANLHAVSDILIGE
jgi:hypothetical protein